MVTAHHPMLRNADIYSYLKRADFPVQESDLTKPSTQAVLRLYGAILHHLVHIPYGQLSASPDDNANDKLLLSLNDLMDHPELHADSMPLMAFYRHLARLMADVGVPHFSLTDILRPEPAVVRAHLSALVNFIIFREDFIQLFDDLSATSDNAALSRDALLQKQAALMDNINSIKLQRQEEEPMVEELMQAKAALAQQLKDLKAKGDAVNDKLAKLKQEKTEQQELLQNQTFALTHCKQECTRLRSRIVHNPEQLKQTIVDMSASLQTIRNTFANNERAARDLHVKLENLSTVQTDLAACLALLQECEEEQRRLQDARKKVANEKERVDRKQSELRDLNLKEQQLQRQEANAKDKITRFHAQLASKQASLDAKLTKLRDEWEALGEERSKIQDQVDEVAQANTETKQKMLKLKQSHEHEIQSIQNDFAMLKSQVLAYISAIRQRVMADEPVVV